MGEYFQRDDADTNWRRIEILRGGERVTDAEVAKELASGSWIGQQLTPGKNTVTPVFVYGDNGWVNYP